MYLVIIFLGLPLTVLYNFCFGILMAFGDSKKSTMFMAVSTVINIFLDLFLVVVVIKIGLPSHDSSIFISTFEYLLLLASLSYATKLRENHQSPYP